MAPIPEPELTPLPQHGLSAGTRREPGSNSRGSKVWSRRRDHLAGGHPPGELGSVYA